jgi:tRNA threonylcarbamoyladenosine biosynthesis protein TsaE
MKKTFTYTAKNLSETKKLAQKLAQAIDSREVLICLYGEIGAGKTAFTRFLAEALGIKQKVTSPSFVILNEYRTEGINLYHFDLYRLEREGVETIIEELSEYTDKENAITVIEWAEFSSGTLPAERLDIEIKYIDEEKREFSIKACGTRYEYIPAKI